MNTGRGFDIAEEAVSPLMSIAYTWNAKEPFGEERHGTRMVWL